MRIRLVIDVLDGRVVRGVAGERDRYRPVKSVLTDSTAPRDVAAAFRDRLGITSLYVADLDGIVHQRPNLQLLTELATDGFEVLADVGIRDEEGARFVAGTGISGVVVALETLAGPNDLVAIVDNVGAEGIVFSLDMKSGEPLRSTDAWPSDPLSIASLVHELGIQRMIVLDLAAVGTGRGVPTLNLCDRIRERYSGLSLVTGGGVRTPADLREAAARGIDELLVASAAHAGSLTREDLTAGFLSP